MKFYYKAIVICISAVFTAAFAVYIYDRRENAAFLNNLQGEIVFNQRDGSGQLNIYTISANGENKKLVFANTDKTNANSLSPEWSEDESKIRFTAMKDGQWKIFLVNPDGGDLQMIEPKSDSTLDHRALDHQAAENIRIERGNIYLEEGERGEKLIYSFRPLLGYDPVFCPGASKASWSPDKQYIVFESCAYAFCSVIIADRNGENAVKLTEGTSPDWK